MSKSTEILAKIDSHLRIFLHTRAMFPHMKDDMVGSVEYSTASFYQNFGFGINFALSDPLTVDQVKEVNRIGYWVNQNYVVRLCALLESYGVISKKNSIFHDLDGHDEIDILRRLRNEFAHTTGRYDPTDSNEKKLRERIISHFSLRDENHPENNGKFPTPIDKVLLPLTEGCKRYVKAWCKRRSED